MSDSINYDGVKKMLDDMGWAKGELYRVTGMPVYVRPEIEDIESPKFKRIPAHPIVCWLSQFVACFGCRLDPWVDVPLPPARKPFALRFGDRLFMSPTSFRSIINVTVP